MGRTLIVAFDGLDYELIQKYDLEHIPQNKFDTILFMSDHGLSTNTEHNTNAFYSCNKELFSDRRPHITDFKDAILKQTTGSGETALDT